MATLLLPISASSSRHKPKKIPAPYKSPLPSSHGSQATTFTRLPPKDSPPDPSLEVSLSHFPHSPLPQPKPQQQRQSEGDSESDGEDEMWEFHDDDDDGSDRTRASVFEDGELPPETPVEKEKGVPAVMRCFDRAKIYVKAGDGGNGVVAFRREKFVPYGGPSGGDGGRGGNVYVEVDGAMNSLLPFRKAVHFRAGSGAHGQGRKQIGGKGEDVVVKVAPGTVVREAGGGEVLLEMMRPGERALLLPGGRGGRGNASFKTGMNKVPKIAENGEEGAEM